MQENSPQEQLTQEQLAQASSDSRSQRNTASQGSDRNYYALLFGLCCVLGLYCCFLNSKLYQHRAPFFDSMSYNQRLFQVMHTTQENGIAEGLELACFGKSTNCLPFIVAAFSSFVVAPSRHIGIWIQAGLLFFLVASLFYFFRQVKQLKPRYALAGCLPFFITRCLYLPNGGLSDFRMDLSLYLTFGMTCVWFLVCMAQPNVRNFLLLGLAAAMASLCRATAPVYLLFALGPLALLELWPQVNRTKKLAGLVIATVVVVLAAGWFYVINFEYLKFYYVDWNTDANAKLPIMKAMKHAVLAFDLVGKTVVIIGVVVAIATVVVTSRTRSIYGWWLRAKSKQEIDWRLAWLAAAPVIMLVARRSGLNPFVSMPTVFGVLIFVATPLLLQLQRLNRSDLSRFCLICLGVASAVSLHGGWKRHTRAEFKSMPVNLDLIDTMVSDMQEQGGKRARFAVAHLGELNTQSMASTLLFDCDVQQREMYRVTIGDVRVAPIFLFGQAAKVDWKQVKGDSDKQKIDFLVSEARQRLDYVVLPDAETADYLKDNLNKNVINGFMVQIRNRFVRDPQWKKIKSGLQNHKRETVELYKNMRTIKKRR